MKRPENNQYVLFGGSFILANKLQSVADKMVEGISSKQWFLLRTLKDMPNEPLPTITSLAKEADSTRQNVTKMLEVLQRQNCVEIGNSLKDQRSRTVQLTEQGLYMLEHMRKQAGDFFERLFFDITEEECIEAVNVMIKMIDNLSKMQEDIT